MVALTIILPTIDLGGAARIGRDCLRFVRSYVSDVLFSLLDLLSFCPPLILGGQLELAVIV